MGKRGRRSSAASFEPEARCGGIRAAEARRGNLLIFSFAALAPPTFSREKDPTRVL